MGKLEKKIQKQEKAIVNSLTQFLHHFDRARYSIEEPVKELEKFFDLSTDWDGVVYIFIKTKEWDLSMGYTTDIDLADLQSVVNYLKVKANVYLRMYKDA